MEYLLRRERSDVKIFRELLIHIVIICTIVCVVAGILDWYNPFMNFGRYVLVEKVALVACILLLLVTGKRKRKRK